MQVVNDQITLGNLIRAGVIVKSGVHDIDQAASWSAVFTSIPSLNLTPVITLAR